jgi:hypothetical protein
VTTILEQPPTFRLIRGDAVAAFTALADKIEQGERCSRVTALQRACDRHPAAYERYVAALSA